MRPHGRVAAIESQNAPAQKNEDDGPEKERDARPWPVATLGIGHQRARFPRVST